MLFAFYTPLVDVDKERELVMFHPLLFIN